MTKDEIKIEVMKIIDRHGSNLSGDDYIELLEEIIDECDTYKMAYIESNDGRDE